MGIIFITAPGFGVYEGYDGRDDFDNPIIAKSHGDARIPPRGGKWCEKCQEEGKYTWLELFDGKYELCHIHKMEK